MKGSSSEASCSELALIALVDVPPPPLPTNARTCRSASGLFSHGCDFILHISLPLGFWVCARGGFWPTLEAVVVGRDSGDIVYVTWNARWISVPKSNENSLRCGHVDIFEGGQFSPSVIIDCDWDPMWHFNFFL